MNIILIYTKLSPFIQADIDILKCQSYQVQTNKKGYLKELWYFMTHRYDLYVTWFCDIHALIPFLIAKLLRKKTLIIAGGYDACYIPKLNYGILRGGIRSNIVKLIYRMADKIILPSEDLQQKLFDLTGIKSEVMNSGVDTGYWNYDKTIPRSGYMTIGNIKDSNTFYRKGIDRFFNMARANPKEEFYLVGYVYQLHDIPFNVTLLGSVSQPQLKYYLNKTKYYCQLSRYESFGYALIEAMSMGCIPIVEDVGIMKFIAGGADTPDKARQRVIDLFSLKTRQDKLNNICHFCKFTPENCNVDPKNCIDVNNQI